MDRREDFAKRLKQLREARSLNVSELAKLIKVSPAAIWHWEHRGTRPRSATIHAISQALGVEPSFLETGKTASHANGPNSQHNGPLAKLHGHSLEELIRAIEAKGFEVSVKSRS